MKIEYFKDYEKNTRKLLKSEEITDTSKIIEQFAMVMIEKQEYSIVYNDNGLKDIRAYNKIIDKDNNVITIVRTFYTNIW